jgi:hypothetical protein
LRAFGAGKIAEIGPDLPASGGEIVDVRGLIRSGQRKRAARRRQGRETPNDPDRRRKPANYPAAFPAE